MAAPDVSGYSNGGTATVDTGGANGRYVDFKAGSNAAALLSGNARIVGATGVALDSAAGTLNGQALTVQGGGASAVVAPVIIPPQTTGGWSSAVLASLTTATVVKASPGTISAIQCDNLAGSTNAFAQIINTAASPALGTNVIGYVPLAAGASGGKVFPLPGVAASTGISVGIATTPTGATAAGTAGNCEVDYK